MRTTRIVPDAGDDAQALSDARVLLLVNLLLLAAFVWYLLQSLTHPAHYRGSRPCQLARRARGHSRRPHALTARARERLAAGHQRVRRDAVMDAHRALVTPRRNPPPTTCRSTQSCRSRASYSSGRLCGWRGRRTRSSSRRTTTSTVALCQEVAHLGTPSPERDCGMALIGPA